MKNADLISSNRDKYKLVKPSYTLVESIRFIADVLIHAAGYECGNPSCRRSIAFYANEPRPTICHKCGIEIEWLESGFSFRSCSTCKREFNIYANYCPYHFPPVQLIETGG